MTRIPERLRRRLEQAAVSAGRSMNAEIIHRLESSLLVGNERLLHALFAAISTEPKWSGEPYEDRPLVVRPVIKRTMEGVIGDFIDSLPGPEYTAHDIEGLERDLQDKLDKIAELKKKIGVEGGLALVEYKSIEQKKESSK